MVVLRSGDRVVGAPEQQAAAAAAAVTAAKAILVEVGSGPGQRQVRVGVLEDVLDEERRRRWADLERGQ